MLKTKASVLALSVALGFAPAAFAQTTTTQEPAAGATTTEGATTTTTVQPAPAEGTMTTQTEGATTTTGGATTTEGTTTTTQETTTTTTEPVQTETTIQPVQTETTTQPVQTETTTQQVETQPAEGQPVPGQIFQQTASQFLGSTLMDANVASTDGESIGEVNDVVVNGNGMIEGVVIGVGGFLGIGEKDVAVQLSQITIQQQEGGGNLTFVLNATREELENAPEFRTRQEQEAVQDAATGADSGAAMDTGGTMTTDPAATGGMVTTDPTATTGASTGGATTTTTTEQPAAGQSQ